ncbi:MAG: DNA polymerase Y family protein [Rhodospirillales bacterium]|nr:DNA polymerase Y family protein [Rhodospirillales bacterium]MBT4038716.1 DNA polymerase Y family protein [Rhodospirillales bacterium]MBT4627761.1 DNA polymerase Y family protein [Rhodospirillales bacterium]MBT5350387.1 DNA polymerase Y family protein [Rhodospirillales bacterium]MBT6110692.1 DNA polymerase Y family protein [Rhodospirillales bacterium]
MRRIVSLWLPDFPVDRARLKKRAQLQPPSDAALNAPFATTIQDRGTVRIAAACPSARAQGVAAGLPLADARARLPNLIAQDADPDGDAVALQQLARWCARYTPWTSLEDGTTPFSTPFSTGAGLWLDITGCAHLLGGEEDLLHDLLGRLSGAGYTARAAVANTPGAAWALARHAANNQNTCDGLPVAGLRLPSAMLDDLHRLGLRTIDDVVAVPRVSLATRFGTTLTRRLDQLSGVMGEPLSPLTPAPPRRARLAFAEPIGTRDDMDAGLAHLLDELCPIMEKASEGARRLGLLFCRMDGTTAEASIGTSTASRDPVHLARLFVEKLDAIDPGFGIEVMILNVLEASTLRAQQMETITPEHKDLAPLVDRLANRLGSTNVARLTARASHMPEQACADVSVMAQSKMDALTHPDALGGDHRPRAERPIHLLPQPEPIDVMAPLPDHPPVLFKWRQTHHRVARADGPERLGPAWWLEMMRTDPRAREPRDYYALEDENGGRYWVYREGPYRPGHTPRWYLHGVFA